MDAVALAVLFVTARCQAPANPQQPGGDTADPTVEATTASTTSSDSTTGDNDSRDSLVRVDHDFGFQVAPIYHRVGRLLDVPRDSNGSQAGYAWTLRWDDASEADEFQSAFGEYADRSDERFRTERVGDETVVVFAGADDFVGNATATGNSSSVTVAA